MSDGAAAKAKDSSGLLKLAIDFGPLIVFVAVNTLYDTTFAIQRVMAATIAFMIATAAAMIVSRWKLGHISPMLWMSGGLVLVFGGLTLWFHNGNFIKVKPTIVYTTFAVILLYGLVTNRPLLKQLMEASYPGLTDQGWRKLTINWTVFFAVMAVVNEIVWRMTSPGPNDDMSVWANFKLWGVMPLTFLFALANIPMLMRNGLSTGGKDEAATPPPEG